MKPVFECRNERLLLNKVPQVPTSNDETAHPKRHGPRSDSFANRAGNLEHLSRPPRGKRDPVCHVGRDATDECLQAGKERCKQAVISIQSPTAFRQFASSPSTETQGKSLA